MARLLFAEMTRDEIGAIAPRAIAPLPTAAIEQHGPQCPVGLDAMCCTAVAHAAADAVSADLPVVVAPVQCYGSSHHHRPWPGVLTLRSETFMRVLIELLESLELSGFRHVLVLNGHGGNSLLIQQTAIVYVLDHKDMHVVAGSYWDVARAALEKVKPAGVAIPGHGGDFESALMLHLHPKLIHHELIPVRDPHPSPLDRPRIAGVADRVWRDNPGARGTGLSDDASKATAEDGRRYFDTIVTEVASLLRSMPSAPRGE